MFMATTYRLTAVLAFLPIALAAPPAAAGNRCRRAAPWLRVSRSFRKAHRRVSPTPAGNMTATRTSRHWTPTAAWRWPT